MFDGPTRPNASIISTLRYCDGTATMQRLVRNQTA